MKGGWWAAVMIMVCSCSAPIRAAAPIVITTWGFQEATDRAWEELSKGGSALDAVEQGAARCEELQCDGTVGYGGSPDEHGETTLDALIMDGKAMNVGAVGALRNIKRAMSVARRVLEHTSHSLLVGELATKFAVSMGFERESLSTAESKKLWKDWWANHCQPNFWMGVSPNPRTTCGPYHTKQHSNEYQRHRHIDTRNHDTIGIVAIDQNGDIAAGTSTNGAKFKIPGRVGDSPLPGSGAYADNTVGAAAGTGDGDVMLRFCPSFLAVDEMRRGASPTEAATTAVERIARHYPDFMGAVVAIDKEGTYGAACHGIDQFPFVVRDTSTDVSVTKHVSCIKLSYI